MNIYKRIGRTQPRPLLYMSKPPLGIGVKRNDLRPWRALAPTRLSWRDPSCGNRWLPGATPPAAPPRPTTTTALLTWARRRLQLRPPVCAQTSPRRPANLSQAAPGRLPDPSKPLPAVSQPQLLRAAPPPALFPRSLPGKQPTGPPGGLAGPPGWPGRLAGQPGPARLGQPARPAGRAGRARLGPLWSPKWDRWTPNHEFVMQFWSKSVGHV